MYCTTDKNYKKRKGTTLVECMVGVILFCLMFTYIFRAFAPTATDSHNMLRGTTIAMNAGNWYLNKLEHRIQSQGALPDSELGENDVTLDFITDEFSDIKMLRSLKVTSVISLENNLYNAKVNFDWGNSDKDKNRNHHFEMSRLLIQPNF